MLRVIPDKVKWESDLEFTFRDLENSLHRGVIAVQKSLQKSAAPTVREGLQRPENSSRNRGNKRSSDLAGAISDSIRVPKTSGTRGGAFLGVGHFPTLDRQAIYWRAIEYGSDHLVGKAVVFGFGVRGSDGRVNVTNPPDSASFRKDPDAHATVSGAAVSANTSGFAAGGTARIVTRPITPHNYLEKISKEAIPKFEFQVSTRLRAAFSGRG